MNRGVGLVLGLLAVVAAVWLGYVATTRIQYLPKRLWITGEQSVPVDERTDKPWDMADCSKSPYPAMDDFRNDWYSRFWRAAEEPSLYLHSLKGQSSRVERFTWLRSFHKPVFIRLDWLPDGEVRMTAKELSGAGGYDPGGVGRMEQRLLNDSELERLADAQTRLRFQERPSAVCSGGMDGARWIIEMGEAGVYVFIDRWSPDGGPVADYGRVLIGLTGWRYDHNDRIY
ncbi:hypothetical protein D3C72_872750 [compost metagenome]